MGDLFWYSVGIVALLIIYGEYNLFRMRKLKTSLEKTNADFLRTTKEMSNMIGVIIEENRRNETSGNDTESGGSYIQFTDPLRRDTIP